MKNVKSILNKLYVLEIWIFEYLQLFSYEL